ncbi:MAG: hypothetical protein KatS3mg102_0515 [Planctomycetota bacterium]|nr:MAG: hypothetical protein KatS3mg102_0515 [Planctomycetota bacterium]
MSAKEDPRIRIRESLPPELRPVLDELAEDYKFYSIVHHGRAFVSYKILADLVRLGWRYCGPQHKRQGEPPQGGAG